jgi:outer membrane protein OmpA-like peptidoglycan-associated protein
MSAATASRVLQRRWVRHDEPVWPFVWHGLLPLLGLLMVGAYAWLPFARDDVQDTVLRETRMQLDAARMPWAQVAVSGQHVTLSGKPPAADARDAALAQARAALCPSWLGRFTCAVDVKGEFAAEPAPPKVEAAPPPAPVSAAPQAAVTAPVCEKALADVVAQSTIEFASGSAAIERHSAPVLDALAKAAAPCPGVIVIEGHTDSIGPPQANRSLSAARAEAVRSALVERGVEAARLRAEGFGADRPLVGNDSAAGRAKNRRIEFRAVAGAS